MKGNARNKTEFDAICINRQTLETGNSVKFLWTVRLLRPSGGQEFLAECGVSKLYAPK